MIGCKIKYNLKQHEIKFILNILNSPDKFSYELAQIYYPIDYIEYLINQKHFVCIIFYNVDSVEGLNDINDEDTHLIKCFVLGKKATICKQISDKLNINLNNYFIFKQNVKKVVNEQNFEKRDTLLVDYIGINAKNKYSLLNDIKYNLEFNFHNCIYKLNNDISYAFNKKYYYYRPINLDILQKTNILCENILTNKFIKVYNTFSYPLIFKNTKSINLNPLITEKEIKSICSRVNNYNLKNFEIYREITEDEISNIFNFDGGLFHKFLIYNKYNELTDMVILMKNKYNSADKTCDNVHYYIGMFENSDIQYKYDILEFICFYGSEYKLFDIMTIIDDISSKKLNTKFLKSIKKEYYYECNMDFNDYNKININ